MVKATVGLSSVVLHAEAQRTNSEYRHEVVSSKMWRSKFTR